MTVCARAIDGHLFGDQGVGRRHLGLARGPAQHGRDPGQQRVHVVGLGHVIVRAQLEPQRFIPAAAPGRQQDHGQPVLALEDAQRVQAIHPGQPDVEQHEIRGRRPREGQPLAASPAVRTR